jgi:CMP/dCMP kinase
MILRNGMDKAPVITIDGPGGAGKGTISRLLAKQLGWHLLESGALYRLLALCAQKHQVAFDDVAGLAALAEALDVQFVQDPEINATQYLLEGINVSTQIMHETCGEAASQISVFLSVRQALLARQRSFRESPGLVAEGRDMGTVIFPDALLKIFLSASIEARAQRRYNQLKQQGIHVNLDELHSEIALRDERDRERVVSPLVPAIDAILLDTTHMDIPAVLERITWLLNQRLYQ